MVGLNDIIALQCIHANMKAENFVMNVSQFVWDSIGLMLGWDKVRILKLEIGDLGWQLGADFFCLVSIGFAVEGLDLQEMDTGKSLDDQFSKLHPCFPVNTRIGIVGAGPSGLSAAYALARLGYSNITVLDKYQTVGGMCESVEIEGTQCA